MDEVILKVNGMNYTGWLSIEIKKSVRALAGMFTLRISDSWSTKKKPWFILPGDYCELYIGKELMISGYIDDLEYSVNASSRDITVTGRDKTGDLVDCSLDTKDSQFTNIKLNNLLEKLCRPFGIKFSNRTLLNPTVIDFKFNQGSSVYDIIDELSKKYGFIACSTPEGDLVIPNIGENFALDYIEEGINLFEGSVKFDHKDRFSKYILKGQNQGTEEQYGEESFSILGKILDPDVKRYRPKVIVESDNAQAPDLERRAEWEMNLRASKSTAGSVTLKGWRQRNGQLWKENTMINYKSPYLGLEAQFLIGDITYSLNDQGRRVTLDFMRKEVFLAEIDLAKGGKKEDPQKQLGKDFFKNE